MKKGGQISAFFIIGIIIVFLGGMALIYRAEIYEKITDLELVSGISVPEEAKNFNDFVLQCVRQTAQDGIDRLGLQGGYIEMPTDKVLVGSINMFSNKLEILPGFRTAYWFYQQDNGVEVTDIPTKEEMSQQLKNYIDANVEECFRDFVDFPDYKVGYRKVSSEVSIKNSEVQVVLNMPTALMIKDQKFNFDTYKTRIKVALGDILELSRRIVEDEAETNFLETKTEDMMVAYEQIPYSGSDLSCGVKTWYLEKVISDFKAIVLENMHKIRIVGTDYTAPRDDLTKYFEWDVGSKRNPNVNAMLTYSKSWPFYLSVTPEEDGILKAQQVTDRMGDVGFVAKSMFCMNDWNFVYDVKYPVLVTLYDKQNDYTFQFAMQVVIERNQPRKAKIVPDFETDKEANYCAFTKNVESSVSTYEEVGLEAATKPLDGVNIKYNCITHSCSVGTTRLNGEDATLITAFPSCIGGTLIADKEGYHSVKELDVDSNKQFSMSMTLEKLIKMPVRIHVNRDTGSGEPSSEEQVIIELEEPDKEYRTMIMYPDQKEVNLIPGSYKVKEYVVRSGSAIKIPGKEVKTCVDVPTGGLMGHFGATEQKCTPTKLPDVELTNLVTGGAEFEWDVSRMELYTSDYVKFYITANPIPESLEELSKVDLKQADTLLPVFLNE